MKGKFVVIPLWAFNSSNSYNSPRLFSFDTIEQARGSIKSRILKSPLEKFGIFTYLEGYETEINITEIKEK